MQKAHGVKIAVEIFDLKCKQLSKTRFPNIFVKNQKELFSDWFEDGIPYPITHLGANDHPDTIIQNVGFELKSLKTNGQIQFNSTIPTGRFHHRSVDGECYYAIARYVEDRSFGQLHDFTICYGDFFNFDHEFAHAHMNSQEKNFGDYGDGVVRYRKMYSFPTPTKQVPGVSLILDTENAERFNPNLILDSYISRYEKDSRAERRFFIYRHKLVIS
ncbi:hypothetical protein FC682_11785 [Peribacillus simplex]|uniref:hypothetical protein n=1 Tax=Peribacillus simplex TaxID=1478 RepID=UPI0010BE5BB6|nr:hypothetical protein [Peribacillus simplex]TKH04814.1 hypothetical protein FC682_11785 [Peribacillus simplex]